MAYQRQQQQFSRQIPATNRCTRNDFCRQSVNDQAAATSFNHPVQMARATTVVNPWLGMNHILLGTNNMVIQGQTNRVTSTDSGPANSLPYDRKRPRVANNENNDYFRVPDYAPQNIKDDMIRLRETHHMVYEQSKRLRMQFAEKENQAVQHLVENVRTPLQKMLKDKDEEIVIMMKLNTELQETIKSLRHENKRWMEYGTTCEFRTMTLCKDLEVALAEVSRLQGLVAPNGAVAGPPHEAQLTVKSNCASNVSPTNTQRTAQGCIIRVKVEDADEIAAEKVQTVAETGEGSGVKKMCMSCGNMEVSVLALPCRHLCFCIVCGTDESRLDGPCPVCDFTMTATVPVSLV